MDQEKLNKAIIIRSMLEIMKNLKGGKGYGDF